MFEYKPKCYFLTSHGYTTFFLSEKYFKENFLFFLDDNRNYVLDFRFNVTLKDEDKDDLLAGKYEVTASRVTYQHVYLANTTVQVAAMDKIKDGMNGITFPNVDISHPIPYSFLYMQWDANRVIM